MSAVPEDTSRRTLSAYELHAAQYIERTGSARSPLVDDLLSVTPPPAHVLELGSGPGRDAADLEAAGLRVDRTDGASAFVSRLIGEGHDARLLDLYADDFGGPYDAIFANAVLLHVDRHRLNAVLATARRATIPGGVIVASFKKGDGREWSHRKLDSPRHFTYWQEEPLHTCFAEAGWHPTRVEEITATTSTERWITVIARNSPAQP